MSDRPLRLGAVIALLAAAAMATTSGAAVAASAGLQMQGRWTYTQRSDRGVVEYMATTPSVQDADAWLLFACRTDERLTVAIIHTAAFQFALPASAPIRLRADGLPDLSVTGKSIAAKQLVIDPRAMRPVMPQLIDADEFAVLIPDRDGTPHEYTFMMQPNDRALAPLRSICLNPASNA